MKILDQLNNLVSLLVQVDSRSGLIVAIIVLSLTVLVLAIKL